MRLKNFNTALLCKIGWLLVASHESIWSKAINAEYLPNSSFMRCKRIKSSLLVVDLALEGLLKIKSSMSKGFCFRVGKKRLHKLLGRPLGS